MSGEVSRLIHHSHPNKQSNWGPPKIVSSVTICSWDASLGLAFEPLTKLGILSREGELLPLLVIAGPRILWESHPSVFGTCSWLWLLEMLVLCYLLLWSLKRLGSRDHMFTSVKSRQWFVGMSVISYYLCVEFEYMIVHVYVHMEDGWVLTALYFIKNYIIFGNFLHEYNIFRLYLIPPPTPFTLLPNFISFSSSSFSSPSLTHWVQLEAPVCLWAEGHPLGQEQDTLGHNTDETWLRPPSTNTCPRLLRDELLPCPC